MAGTRAGFLSRAGGVVLAALALAGAMSLAPRQAAAQAMVAIVNGDPITSVDVDQRMRLLRLLRKPATRPAAVEDLIDDAIKLREMAKYSIKVTEQDILGQGARDAQAAGLNVASFGAALNGSGVPPKHWQDHFKAELTWNIFVAAFNKTVEVSEEEVRAELARRGKSATVTEYTLRQVIFVVSPRGGASIDQRGREAQALRAKFTSCDAGVPLARAIPDVAVRENVVRNSNALSPQLRQLFDRTEIGHLTPPSRSESGLEMVAVCDRRTVKDDASASADVQQELLTKKLKGDSDARFAELKKRAVIIRK